MKVQSGIKEVDHFSNLRIATVLELLLKMQTESLSPALSTSLSRFMEEVRGQHLRTPSETTPPLHYNSLTKSLTEYAWYK